MRATVLLCGLLLATGASAAPTTPAEVGKVMQALGMNGLGEQGAATMVELVPSLAGLDDAGRACATGQIGRLMEAQMQQQIVTQLGEDGTALMQDWSRFLATPAGQDMGRAFRAASPTATAADRSSTDFSEAHKSEIAAFMASPTFQRFIAGIAADGGMPDDVGQRMAGALQNECSIAFDPEEIS